MRSFTFITALLLCSLSWISVSGSDSQILEVRPGDEVVLTCPNISTVAAVTEWFRLINRTKPSCIASMVWSDGKASYCDGFQNGFEMSSNKSTVFLKIKRVELSDSGLYFCGIYMYTNTVTASVTNVKVQGNADYDDKLDFNTQKESVGMIKLMSVILGGLTVFLTIVVIVLAVKNRKLQTAMNEEVQPERNKNLDSDELNYTALSFQAKPKRSRRPASEREVEPHVVYAATR